MIEVCDTPLLSLDIVTSFTDAIIVQGEEGPDFLTVSGQPENNLSEDKELGSLVDNSDLISRKSAAFCQPYCPWMEKENTFASLLMLLLHLDLFSMT